MDSSGTSQKANPVRQSSQPGLSATIPDMFGSRIRKRSIVGRNHPSKACKTMAQSSPGSVLALAANSSLSADSRPSSKSLKQLKLSEMLRKDRLLKLERATVQPSIIVGAPHMDTRRPQHSKDSIAGRLSQNNTPTEKPRNIDLSSQNEHTNPSYPLRPPKQVDPSSLLEKQNQVPTGKLSSINSAQPFRTELASTRISASGAEAIIYDRGMLPSRHGILLDILVGLESAIGLLRTRRTPPSFLAVKDIVSKSSKRTFTFRHLSQLAHIVPEAVCVLPPEDSRLKGRDHLIIRLDDVSSNELNRLEANAKKTTQSQVGDSATRSRRRLLHRRLLDHVRDHHVKFLKDQGISTYESNLWHPDFDLDIHVPDLPAPPLYPICPPRNQPNSACTKQPNAITNAVVQRPEVPENDGNSDECDETTNKSSGDGYSCIPMALLKRVRARATIKEERKLKQSKDHRTDVNFIAKLPATMDAIASILRSERRMAFGWSQLLSRLQKLHPHKWDSKELERQVDSITEMAPEWCTKISLSGPRGGYAFRIKSDRMFTSQRSKVVSAISQASTTAP